VIPKKQHLIKFLQDCGIILTNESHRVLIKHFYIEQFFRKGKGKTKNNLNFKLMLYFPYGKKWGQKKWGLEISLFVMIGLDLKKWTGCFIVL